MLNVKAFTRTSDNHHFTIAEDEPGIYYDDQDPNTSLDVGFDEEQIVENENGLQMVSQTTSFSRNSPGVIVG